MEYSGYEQKYQNDKITIYQADCMKMLPQIPDKYYQLCIVDPPYGINWQGCFESGEVRRANGTIGRTSRKAFVKKQWDSVAPKQEYFDQLFRCSINQVIWGGNYFSLNPTRGVICWDKLQPFETFSAWEMAWTSFSYPAKIFRYDNKGFMNKDGRSIHPAQKPVALYDWILRNYAKPGDKILDTHLGSGSSAIAADIMGFDFVGYEIDKDYYEAALDRFNRHKQQCVLEFTA